MVLSFVLMGGLLSSQVAPDRLAAALLAFFLGLGVSAHALDQLEPEGSHYVQHLTRNDLILLAVAGLLGSVGIGLYYVITLTPYLILFVFAEVLFATGYPLPHYVFGGRLHNNASFVFSWGYLPFLSGYYISSLTITPLATLLGVPVALAAWTEIKLSRSARSARKAGLEESSYQGLESALKLLVASVYSLAALMAVLRLG